jgi:hypothetical protein
LYAEAMRRGGAKREQVVIGDGAAWLWSLAELHFPEATCILDWFHASEYVWNAAKAIWGDADEERKAWAERQLGLLWAGRVREVIAELETEERGGAELERAATYFTNQQAKMAYPTYRARGFPIGSGAIESGCKQMVSGRLKGAGMRWEAKGAQGVVKVRAWQRSGRWEEAMGLRSRPQRRRCTNRDEQEAVTEGAGSGSAGGGLPAEVLAKVREELAQKPNIHPWRKPWSTKRQIATA